MGLLSPDGEHESRIMAASIVQLIWAVLLVVAATVLFA